MRSTRKSSKRPVAGATQRSSKTSGDASTQWRFVLFAMLAGAFGGMSGVAGKLSVSSDVAFGMYLRVILFGFNALCTAQMWRYYLKALALGPTPTCQIINTGTNFILSAALGLAFFGEEVNALWCTGASLVLVGLGIIASDPDIPKVS